MENRVFRGSHNRASLLSVVLVMALFATSPGYAESILGVSFDKLQGDKVPASPTGIQGLCSTRGRGPLWCQGVSGQAAWFTGDKNEQISFDAPAIHQPGETFGLRCWLYPTAFGFHQGVVWKGDRSKVPEQCQYKLTIRPEGTVEFGCKGPRGEWAQLISSIPLPLRRWTQITVSFQKGASAMWFDAAQVAKGELSYPKAQGGGNETIRALPVNSAPLLLGRGEASGGDAANPYCGALDELALFTEPIGPEARDNVSQADPLKSILLFEKTLERAQAAATPVLTGTLRGTGAWLLEVSDPRQKNLAVWQQGTADTRGEFRYLMDDFAGPFDLGAARSVRLCAYRRQADDTLTAERVRFIEGARQVTVTVEPGKTFQRLRRQAAYANAPKLFLTNAQERARVYGPVLEEMRTAGISHFDFALGSLAAIEPRNDDGDPRRLDMDFFRANFKASAEARSLVSFIRYVGEEGFTFGIRSTGFAPWQAPTDPATGAARHQVDEIAECWVALLLLLKEEGLAPTHLIPVWEPTYAPETVAQLCAVTGRLAREHGFTLPVVGPYVLTTGGQSSVMTAMPDKYETGARYTKAYLDAIADARIVGLEDYASGTPLIRPNLKRLWEEVIDPVSAGKARELWMLEYGAPCGVGPWNFFPSRWHGALSTWEAAFRLARAMNQLLDGGVSGFFFWKAWDAIGEDAQTTPSSWGLVKGPRHDVERRPPFHTGRVFWKNLPEGAVRVGCEAEQDLAVNAVRLERQLNVFLINPRAEVVTANVVVAQTALAPQARLVTATETTPYQEQEVYGQGVDRFLVSLPPRSVSALLCRLSGSAARFTETRWPAAKAEELFLSELDWLSSSTRGNTKPFSNGLQMDWRRDETITGEWIVQKEIRYRRGLTHLGKGEITFLIPTGAARFEALVGVDDGSAGEGPATFQVKVDGRVAAESRPLKKGVAPEALAASLGSARVVTLAIDTADARANVAWLEARFVMEGGR